jgi:hypothetical protein
LFDLRIAGLTHAPSTIPSANPPILQSLNPNSGCV